MVKRHEMEILNLQATNILLILSPSGLQGLKENEVEVDGDLYSDTAVTVIDLEAEAPSEMFV